MLIIQVSILHLTGKRSFKEAYNEYGCVTFCEDSSKCKYRNKFDHRIKKAISLTR